MKKFIFPGGCAAVLLALALLLLSLPSPAERALAELEQNCDVPFRLTTPEKELPGLPDAVPVEGFGGYRLENGDLSLALGGYPDVLDSPCLISFTLLSPRYALFGLQVGDALDKAEKALTEHGYQPVREDIGTDWTRPLSYTKGPLTVALGLSEDLAHLSSLTVSVAVSNRENVVF